MRGRLRPSRLCPPSMPVGIVLMDEQASLLSVTEVNLRGFSLQAP